MASLTKYHRPGSLRTEVYFLILLEGRIQGQIVIRASSILRPSSWFADGYPNVDFFVGTHLWHLFVCLHFLFEQHLSDVITSLEAITPISKYELNPRLKES